MRLTRRHAQLFLSGKRMAYTLIEDELRDLQKETREFETKKSKIQAEISLLESIIRRREKETEIFQNLKPLQEKP